MEGSRPLEVAVPVKDVEQHVEEENQLQKVVEYRREETAYNIIELPSQYSCTITNVESPD